MNNLCFPNIHLTVSLEVPILLKKIPINFGILKNSYRQQNAILLQKLWGVGAFRLLLNIRLRIENGFMWVVLILLNPKPQKSY